MGVGAGNRQSDIPARGRELHDPRVGGLVGQERGHGPGLPVVATLEDSNLRFVYPPD